MLSEAVQLAQTGEQHASTLLFCGTVVRPKQELVMMALKLGYDSTAAAAAAIMPFVHTSRVSHIRLFIRQTATRNQDKPFA